MPSRRWSPPSPGGDDAVPAPLITEPAAVEPTWMTAALAGVAAPATAVVTDVALRPIGAGKVGDSLRASLSWDPPEAGPASVVVKLPAADPASRNAGVVLGNYEREVRFYRHLADTLDVGAPRCHLAELDESTGMFVLVLADLAPAEVGDQLEGCDLADAEAAVVELVGLHAPRLGDPGLESHAAWLGPRLVGGGPEVAAIYTAVAATFLERYAGAVDDVTVATVEALLARVGRWAEPTPGPVTVTHNDYRLDNILFGEGEQGRRAHVVDWQTVGLGPGIADVSYFLGAGLVPEQRRTHERELVATYLSAMAAAGVVLDADETWHEYRRSCLAGLVMAVFASAVVGADPRSDAMFTTMAERHAHQAADLDALALLDGRR